MRRRGLTLVETMVSSALFGLVAILVVVIVRLGYRSDTKSQIHSDAQRAVLVALEKMRQELKGGVIINAIPAQPGQTAELEFLYVPRDEPVNVDFTGHPLYAGPARFVTVQTRLMRLEPDHEDKQLVDLGTGGSVEFEMASAKVMKTTVKITRPDPTRPGQVVSHQQAVSLYFENQP